jgi:threonine dehydrogenase-like Zn-dependent dehydrogenase
MHAVAVFPKSRRIEVVDHEAPRPIGATEVRVRILDVGVCGTDKEICCFEYGTPPAGSEYLVLGHEAVGEVVEVGPAVNTLRVGELVVPMVRRPCEEKDCVPCRSGRSDFCTSGEFTERGIKERHGFMTEYVVDDERYFVPVPRELREVAVLVEPLTIAEKALKQVWQVQQRLPWGCPHAPKGAPGVCHHAVILGAGPVGLLGAMAFKAAGFGTYVYSREPEGSEKAKLVESFGAVYVSGETTPVEQLIKTVGNIDVVYEATGASKLSFEVLKHVGPNAAFIFTGVPGRKGPVSVDTDLLMRNMVLKNQVVFGTVNAGRETFEDAVRDLKVFMQRWPHAVRALITGRYGLDDVKELLTGGAGGIKNVVSFDAVRGERCAATAAKGHEVGACPCCG